MDENTPGSRSPRGRRDHMLLAVMLGVLLFNSPLFEWWVGEAPPWYVPYALWGLLITAIALVQLGNPRDD